MLASPMPLPGDDASSSPAPVSATTSATSVVVAPARVTSTRPPRAHGSMPCLIAFSTSVISMPGGSGTSPSVVRDATDEVEAPAEPRAA